MEGIRRIPVQVMLTSRQDSSGSIPIVTVQARAKKFNDGSYGVIETHETFSQLVEEAKVQLAASNA